MPFFESVFGHYLSQAVAYSVVAAAFIEVMLGVWRVREPLLQMKFRLMALALPVFCPLLYYLFDPSRGRPALLDVNRWLVLRLAGGVTLGHVFGIILLGTAVYCLWKELLPAARYYLGHRSEFPEVAPGRYPQLDAVRAVLSRGQVNLPRILLSPEETPLAYVTGRALVISASLLDLLDEDELQAVISHEVAHSSRQVVLLSCLLLALRWLLFYNPVAIFIFHLVVSDREKLCDDLAIRLSGKKLSLTSGLLKVFRYVREDSPVGGGQRRLRWRPGVQDDAARRGLVRERVQRITRAEPGDAAPFPGLQLAFAGVILAGLLYFVV